MNPTRRTEILIPLLTVVSDVLAIGSSFLLSYWIRFSSPFADVVEVTLGVPPFLAYLYGSFVVIPVWILIFGSRGMYGARRTLTMSDEFLSVVKLVTVGMLIVMSAAFFYRAFSYSRLVFGLIWLSSVVLITIGRFLVLEFEKSRYRRGRDLREVIIVGGTPRAHSISRTVKGRPSLGYRVVGYFSAEPAGPGTDLASLAHLGGLEDVAPTLRSRRVDLALIALRSEEHPRLTEIIRECEGINVEFMMVPDLLEMMTSRVRVQEIEGIPLIRIKDIPLGAWDRALKRTFDVAVSSAVLLLASPLMLAAAILLKLTSKGPAFFRQERVGLDGRSFQVLKFRTMPVNAELETGPVWAQRDDPRVTGIGRILRRFSIDELPQLFNVLRGDMSIVGPRPERPHFVEEFSSRVPKYLERHRVKTGITGWAQVNGLRGDTSIDERTKYDVFYVENWSLGLDIKIILRTIKEILVSRHAY